LRRGLVRAVAGIGLAALLTTCGGGTATTTSATHSSSTTTSTLPATTTTTRPSFTPIDTLGVGLRSDVYVDTTRPTPANGGAPGSPTRSMPTSVWYPATGVAPGTTSQNAAPDTAHGPYPLVVFAHGFAVIPITYAALLARWASAGYVVVAPEIPLLNGNAPGGASHIDYGAPNIADLDFVLGDALRRAATPGDPLAGLIDPTKVAVAGHSDGEVLAYALAFEACCHDSRVKAVIPMAGNLANAEAPPTPTGVPVLHILDDHDQYDSYSASIAWDRQNLLSPRELLTLVSGVHLPPFSQPSDPHFDLVARATVDFLDATVKGRADGLSALQTLVSGSPNLATLEGTPATTPTS
jgi:dienelactone hydrolase